ncbi:hypothetical protein SADUNF_Sadunf16G0066500 [Salix dunnii]|uniref:Uncharacterized protein n=1 Tax=Salix dunnii TaxID=1413687 RepID=A0A835J7E7_9ROSI|nr:hypothetical protein SADUNF_Sadunf16G0066500 [Salix dunnii]
MKQIKEVHVLLVVVVVVKDGKTVGTGLFAVVNCVHFSVRVETTTCFCYGEQETRKQIAHSVSFWFFLLDVLESVLKRITYALLRFDIMWLSTLLQIILSQENNIQKLNELVQTLQEQLQQCRSENYVLNSTTIPLTEHLNEFEQQPVLED